MDCCELEDELDVLLLELVEGWDGELDDELADGEGIDGMLLVELELAD